MRTWEPTCRNSSTTSPATASSAAIASSWWRRSPCVSDPTIIDALYEASVAGCEIDLIVRSVCCLRPGVPGLSERIRVRSIVGRFLEHSRIFRFGTNERKAQYYLGSADLMQRNLDLRVEAMVSVTRRGLRARLAEILEVNLADDVLAWELGPDGSWAKVPTVAGVSTHERLQEIALARQQGKDGDRGGRA
jgi:polyphosphate kinase